MNGVCFDTSGEKGCVTLIKDGKIAGSLVLSKIYGHNETLLPSISIMLKESGMDVTELNTVGFVRGPGSFTGLRIGAAVAYGLKSVSPDLKLSGYSSLYLLNRQLHEQNHSYNLALIDARRKQVYSGCFKDGKPLMPYLPVPPSDLKTHLEDHGIKDFSFNLSGSGLDKYKEVIIEQFPDACEVKSENCLSRALALEILNPLNEEKTSEELLYIRKSDAELNKNKKT